MHPELNWLGLTKSGQKPGPLQASPGYTFVTVLSLCRLRNPHFGCTGLRSVSCGRAHLKPNRLTVPRQAIFENNLEKVGLEGRVWVRFVSLMRQRESASHEPVREQLMLVTSQ